MAILKREEHLGVDITSEYVALTYTRPVTAAPAVVIPRIDLTSVGGGGIYVGRALIDGNQVTPKSSITFDTGQTKGVLQGREITVEAGDILTVTVTGQGSDTAADIHAALFDNTPLTEDALDGITGSGEVEVNHNYGGADNLRYVVEEDGAGIGDAVVRAYLSDDYSAGNRTTDYLRAEVRTASDGRWQQTMMLDPNDYTLVFYKPGHYGPDVRQITVSA